MSSQDYEDHLASLKQPFLNSSGIKIYKMDDATQKYIESLISDIIANNEIFFKKLKEGKITIVDTEAPLHFSLPKGMIFISRGLITKYLKTERI